MSLFYDLSLGSDRVTLQDFEPSGAESFRNVIASTQTEEYTESFTGQFQLSRVKGGQKLSATEAKEYLDQFEYKINLKPKDNEYSKEQLDIVAARSRELAIYNDVSNRTPFGIGSIPRGLAMFATSMMDPVNIAGAFLPWTKLVQGVSAVQKFQAMRLSTSALTRAGGRVGLGATDALISTALIEPFYMAARQRLGDDYDAYDSMQNIAFSALVGGAIVGTGGYAADVFRKQAGRVAPSERFRGLSTDEIMLVRNLDSELAKGDLTPTALNAVLDSYTPEMRRAAGFPEGRITGESIEQRGFERAKSTQVSIREMDGVLTATNGAGFAKASVNNGALIITEVNVPKSMQGKGNATAITEALANRAIDNGLTVETGSTVSKDFENVLGALERNGYKWEYNTNATEFPPSAEYPSGSIVSNDGLAVFKISRAPDYVAPTDLAFDQVTRADPETREATMRVGVAQMVEGKNINIDPVMRTDSSVDGSVTSADLLQAAKNNNDPENIGAADFEASARIESENASSQGWDSLSDAELALKDAELQLDNAIKAGDQAFKFSRGATAPIPDGIGALGFYSALGRGVDAMTTKASTPEGWKQAIKGLVNKGLVKQDEIEWTGVNEWLDLQSGKVSKEQINEFLQNNGVKIEEVKLGDEDVVKARQIAATDIEDTLRAGAVFDDDAESALRVWLNAEPNSRTAQQQEALLEEKLSAAGDNRTVAEYLDAGSAQTDATKYNQYQLAGGKNYRELLLTLPVRKDPLTEFIDYAKEKYSADTPRSEYTPEDQTAYFAALEKYKTFNENYRSSHWDQPNVLTHIRINDRIDATGAKVLFVEELQSDWAQEGRKKGFDKKYQVIDANGNVVTKFDTEAEASDYVTKNSTPDDQMGVRATEGLPLAPFIEDTKSWLSLSLKRVMNYAVENGYDKVAFVNGKQSADRYSLSKQVKSIEWSGYDSRGATKIVTIYPVGGNAIELPIDANGLVVKTAGTQFDGKPIDEIVGKEIAKQIVEQRGGELSGSGLEVGGEGMISFYDKIVPNVTKDLLKKFGGDGLETVNIVERKALRADKETDELFTQLSGEAPPTEFKADYQQTGFTITDKMRKAVSGGLPLFARGAYLGTAKNLTELVSSSFGKDTQKLLDAGQIKIVDKVSDVPGGPYPLDVKGATAPDGTVYMVAENLSASQVKSVVLHEVGVHVGMRKMLGDTLFNDVLKQLDAAVVRGESWAQAARDSVPSDTPLLDIPEEELAYLVQNSPELGIVKQIIAAVRAWFYRTFESARERMQLTEADFRELAVSALRYAARQNEMQQGVGFKFSRGETLDTSTVKADVEVAEAELKKARSFSNALRAAADKLDNDVLAVQAMKEAMPEISAAEIDELLRGLRTEVQGLRSMSRAARESLLAAQRADDMQSDAMIAANKMAADGEQAAVVKKRNTTLDAAARLRMLSFANQFRASGLDAEGFYGILASSQRVREGARLSVDAEAKAFRSEFLGGMLADMSKANVLDVFISGAFDREIYNALYKLGTKNPDLSALPAEAVTVANIVNKYQTSARNRRNRFGAWIRDLTGYITRQSHDMYKIRAATEDEWVSFVKDKLDIPKMIRLGLISQTDSIGSLRGLYNDFASGVHIKNVAGEDDNAAFSTGANLAKRESVSRSLYFKDGLAAFEYNEKFGVGRLSDSVLHGLDRSAQSAALLKLLGTNPEANLKRVMDEYESSLTGERRQKFREKRESILNMLRQVDGTVNIPGNVTAAKIGSNLRAWQTMSKLGGSTISSFSDVAGFAAEIRYAQNKNLLTGVGEAIGSLLRGRASGEQAEILVSLGVFHESVAGAITSRFDAPELSGKMAAVMRQYFRFNGLTWWTEALRDGAALSYSGFLAAQKSKAFADLDPSVSRVLTLYNINDAKWDLMRQGTFRSADGVQYLTPDAIRTIPREKLEAYIASVGRTPNDTSVQNLIDDLSQTMRTMFLDRAHTAVLEPGARARAFMYRGTQPGTIWGEVARYIGQFKSFSVAMTQMVLGREVYGRGYDTIGDYLRRGVGDMVGLVTMMGLYAVFGYGSMAVKDLLKGRKPRDPIDPKTWMAALAQSGGAGIYGDFLFGEVARNSGSFVSTIAGPVLGVADTVMNLAQRMRDGDDVAAASFRALLNNTPFLNLFYLRPLLDYLFLFNIQESLNPGFLRRMEQRIERENNQTFFIKPSEVVR